MRVRSSLKSWRSSTGIRLKKARSSAWSDASIGRTRNRFATSLGYRFKASMGTPSFPGNRSMDDGFCRLDADLRTGAKLPSQHGVVEGRRLLRLVNEFQLADPHEFPGQVVET